MDEAVAMCKFDGFGNVLDDRGRLARGHRFVCEILVETAALDEFETNEGPAIVFADEPTGALNSSMTLEVMDALSGIHAEGRTIVMVTHDPACAARADREPQLLQSDRRGDRKPAREDSQRQGVRGFGDDIPAFLRRPVVVRA